MGNGNGVASFNCLALAAAFLQNDEFGRRDVVTIRHAGSQVAPLARRSYGWRVLLEPEAVLVVVAEQLGALLLIGVEEDAPVRAAAETPNVRGRVACGVALLQEVAERIVGTVGIPLWRPAPLHKMRAPDAAVFAQIATCALVAHARGLPRTFQEGDRSVPVRLVVLKGLRVANGGDDIQRDVHGRVKGVVIGRGAREWARDPDGAASVHNGAGEELDGGGQPLPRAVLGLGAASTNLLLKDTIGACDDGVRRVRHRERIEPDAEPPFGGPREGDRCRAFLHIQLEAKGDTHIRGDLGWQSAPNGGLGVKKGSQGAW